MRLGKFKGGPSNSLPKTSVFLNAWKVEMTSAAVILGGVAFHAAIAMSGIASKRGVLPKHEISKSSAKAPTFLLVVHGYMISAKEPQVLI
jgi:hypothetical protein